MYSQRQALGMEGGLGEKESMRAVLYRGKRRRRGSGL